MPGLEVALGAEVEVVAVELLWLEVQETGIAVPAEYIELVGHIGFVAVVVVHNVYSAQPEGILLRLVDGLEWSLVLGMPRLLRDVLVEWGVIRYLEGGPEEHELLSSCRHRHVGFWDP